METTHPPRVVLQFEGSYKQPYDDDAKEMRPMHLRVVLLGDGRLVTESATGRDHMGELSWITEEEPAVQLLAKELVRART